MVREAVARAGLEGREVDDVIMGCAAQQGTQGYNIGRLSAIAAGLPASVPGMALDRMCSSGLMSIAVAARSIACGDADIVVAGGVESITLTQNRHKNSYRARAESVLAQQSAAYMGMIETAEVVSRRYGISRIDQDAYALVSQQRTAAAQASGKFDDEIVPLASTKQLFDKEGNPTEKQSVTLAKDEGARAETTLEIPSGGAMAMAGLIQDQTKQAVNGVPGIMQLPVLGSLFRSRDYINNQTELMVLVTPYVVRAVAQKDLSRPDDGFAAAADPQAELLGSINRIYGAPGHGGPARNYRGQYGFITD